MWTPYLVARAVEEVGVGVEEVRVRLAGGVDDDDSLVFRRGRIFIQRK